MLDLSHCSHPNKIIGRLCFSIIIIMVCFSNAFCEADIFPKKENFLIGESITITPHKNGAIGNKYNLLSTFNNGEWKIIINQFSDSIKYKFKNSGLYSLQIDTINAAGQIVEKYWLGQFYVGPSNIKYIKGISWRPYKITFKKGEEIDFITDNVEPEALDGLEFQLLMAKDGKEWIEAIPWHHWPLPKFINNEFAPFALQINVRQKNSYLKPQNIFIGNFLPQKSSDTRDNFLSAIIAHHRDLETTYDSLEESVAKELNLSIHLLYWSYLQLSLKDKIARSKLLSFGLLKENMLYIKTKDGVNLVADLENNSITDGFVTIYISLRSHPYINDIFKQVNKMPEEVKISAVAVYLLYSHYNYSEVPARLHRPFYGLRDINSMCNLNAILLQNIIKHFGYSIKPICFAHVDKANGAHNLISSHAINEIHVNGQYYVLDATTNRIGQATNKSLAKTKRIPEFIILPQSYDAASIYKYSITDICAIPQISLDRIYTRDL